MSTIKLTRDAVFGINRALNSLEGNFHPKLKYAIKKNKDLLKGEVEAIQEAQKTNVEDFEKFEKVRMEKVMEYAEKDEKGNPVLIRNGQQVKILEDKIDDFNAAMLLLNEEYKEAISQREEELKKFNEFVLEEVEVEVYSFSNELIPETVSQVHYETLFPLIKEED